MIHLVGVWPLCLQHIIRITLVWTAIRTFPISVCNLDISVSLKWNVTSWYFAIPGKKKLGVLDAQMWDALWHLSRPLHSASWTAKQRCFQAHLKQLQTIYSACVRKLQLCCEKLPPRIQQYGSNDMLLPLPLLFQYIIQASNLAKIYLDFFLALSFLLRLLACCNGRLWIEWWCSFLFRSLCHTHHVDYEVPELYSFLRVANQHTHAWAKNKSRL